MIAIIEYGMGNVGSVYNAVTALGFEAEITASPGRIEAASHLILPGVGSFDEGMVQLAKRNLIQILETEVLVRHKPILGICLGMQMLATRGEEGKGGNGLGWIPGLTRRLTVDTAAYRLPHVGWNDVEPRQDSVLFERIAKPIFYFVHSYQLIPEDPQIISGTTSYGEAITAAIEWRNIFGVQFHPEKSQHAGLDLLANFLSFE